jgi:hypothetical protein
MFAYVLVPTHIGCKRLFKMFHLLCTYVASVLSRYLDIAYVVVDIHIRCKRML